MSALDAYLSTSVLAANDDIRDLQDTGPMDEWRLIKNNEIFLHLIERIEMQLS